MKFKSLQTQDIFLLISWLNKEHVKSWWDDHLTNEEIKEKYSQLIGNKIVNAFIVYCDELPIGYIQYYRAAQVGGDWWPNTSVDTVGIILLAQTFYSQTDRPAIYNYISHLL